MPPIETWLQGAVADAERQGLQDVRPVLEAVALAAAALRRASWNADASKSEERAALPPNPPPTTRG